MPFDDDLAARIRRVFGGRRDVVEKQMFGGVCFMVRGHMCCGLVGSTLMVRLAPEDAERLADEPHVRPMDFTGRPMRGFLYVETEGLATARSLRTWVERTVAFAESKPRKAVKPTRAARPKTKRGGSPTGSRSRTGARRSSRN